MFTLTETKIMLKYSDRIMNAVHANLTESDLNDIIEGAILAVIDEVKKS